MKILVTGSSGHLGEGLVRVLNERGLDVLGLDASTSPFTHVTGSITDPACVREAMRGRDVVLHTATLHKPHIATHSRQQFVDTNVSGTLCLLEEATRAGVRAFVFTSSTSVFGEASRPPEGLPAAWVTERVVPVPRNIYGITKLAAEELCRLFNRRYALPCVVLRTSRFFPEEDDDAQIRREYEDGNVKANELLFRRVDLEDAVEAHILAAAKAGTIGFGRFIISATTPFSEVDVHELRRDAPAVVRKYVPHYAALYADLGWRMFRSLDRVYVNDEARRVLEWTPRYDFARVLESLGNHADPRSPLARRVGSKGYHTETFEQGPYPVE